MSSTLAAGQQPDIQMIDQVGYLFRTTAVYGAGKFGAADRAHWSARPEFAGSFQPEMLAVWLIRAFSVDIAEHMAQAKSPSTATLLTRPFAAGLASAIQPASAWPRS